MKVATARTLDPPPLRRVARAGLLSLGTSVAMQGLNVISGVALARTLGPAGRGELAAVLLWPGILAGVGGLSVAEGVAYFTARDAMPVRATAATALAISTAQALLLVAVGYLMMPVLLGHYGARAVFEGRLYMAALPLLLLGGAGVAILLGKQQWVMVNLVRVAVTAVIVGGLIVLLGQHRLTVLSATWVYVTATLLGFALPVGVVAARGWLGARPDRSLVRPVMTFGLKAHVGNMAGQANLNLDKMAIATFLAPRDLGLYSVAVTLSSPLTLIGSSIGFVALPAVAACASPVERRQQFAWLVRSALLLSVATTIVLVLLTPVLIRFFFGAAFVPGVVVAQVTIAASLARGVGYVLGYGLCAFEKPLVPSVAELVAVLITVVGLAALLPAMGLVGAAVTSLLAYTTGAGVMLWFARSRLGIGLADLLVPRAHDVVHWMSCLRP